MAFAFFPVFEAMLSLFEETRPRQMCPGGEADVSRVHRTEVIRRAGADQMDHLRAVLVACVLREDGEGSAVVIRFREIFAERGVRIRLRFFRFGPAVRRRGVLGDGRALLRRVGVLRRFPAGRGEREEQGERQKERGDPAFFMMDSYPCLSDVVFAIRGPGSLGLLLYYGPSGRLRQARILLRFCPFFQFPRLFLSERPCARAYLMLYSKQKAGQP